MIDITFDEMMKNHLQKLYSIEVQLADGLKMLCKMAQNPDLKSGLEKHRTQTEEHARRIERICGKMGWPAIGLTSKTLKAMQMEVAEELNGADPSPVVDAIIIGAGQISEHIEIAAYGAAIALAKQLGDQESAELLRQTLQEEKDADEILTKLAESGINQNAINSRAFLS